MKLLLDQNLSFRLIGIIETAFPNSKHVRDLGLTCASDAEVWSYAQNNDFAIVSKDADFANLAFLHGQPPKLVYVRIGNCSTEQMAELLLRSQSTISAFLNDLIEAVLTLQ
jgi:predicted nuclease of predicted toxin-antitoxin system